MHWQELPAKDDVRELTHFHEQIAEAYPDARFSGIIRDGDTYYALFDETPPDDVLNSIVEIWTESVELEEEE